MHRFEVWAPFAKARCPSKLDGEVQAMSGPDDRRLVAAWGRGRAGAGTDYGFLVNDDARCYPDPRSQWQPNGVHGLSRLYDQTAFAWTRRGFSGASAGERHRLRTAYRHIHSGGYIRCSEQTSSITWLSWELRTSS